MSRRLTWGAKIFVFLLVAGLVACSLGLYWAIYG